MVDLDFLESMKTRLQKLFGGARSFIKSNAPRPLRVEKPPEQQPTVTPTPTPSPAPATEGVIPGGTGASLDYIRSLTPPGQTEGQAFPALADQDFMSGVAEADKMRQGLSNLLLLQALFESTMGRATPNVFGVKPEGESRYFDNPSAALEYQLGPNVLGGGATPEMNILDSNVPLTLDDIVSLYSSYNPEGDYLDQLLRVLEGG